jgi:hypothetical protein
LRDGVNEEGAIQVHVARLATRFRNEQAGVTGCAVQRSIIAGYRGIVIGADRIIRAQAHAVERGQ